MRLHQAVQSLSLHHGEQPGLVLSPCFPERHSPGGAGGGGGSGGGGGGAGRQKAHEEHLHQVQCTAACLGWHMAVHRLLGVSPVWAEGQVAGRSYPMLALGGRQAGGTGDGGRQEAGSRRSRAPCWRRPLLPNQGKPERRTPNIGEVLVGPPWRMESNAGQQQWY